MPDLSCLTSELYKGFHQFWQVVAFIFRGHGDLTNNLVKTAATKFFPGPRIGEYPFFCGAVATIAVMVKKNQLSSLSL